MSQICQIYSLASYICDHFATFTRSNLAEELQDQNFRHIPGEVAHIPGGDKEDKFHKSSLCLHQPTSKGGRTKEASWCFVAMVCAYTG